MRSSLFIFGCSLLAVIWLGPLPRWATHSFSAHMAMHMGVVAVAAAFLGAGIAGGRWDPVRRLPEVLSPIPASIVELVVVWAWHAPALHHFARQSLGGLMFEQGSFLISGWLVWISAFGGATPRSAGRAAAGVVGLLLTSMHMTLLGALLALTPRVLYAHDSAAFGLTPLQDQHLGGAIMLLVGGIAYLLGGLFLTVEILRRPSQRKEVQA